MNEQFSAIPIELKKLKRWVCAWKTSKTPMQAGKREAASTADPTSWETFDNAAESVQIGNYDNIGFVFNGDGYVGIDLDCGYDEDGFLTDDALDIITHCHSYTELSRSGRGFHIIVKGKLPFSGKNNRKGVEIYASGRYFIMTGKKMFNDEIAENNEAIEYILNKYFPDEPIEKESVKNFQTVKFYKVRYEKPLNGIIKLKCSYPEIPNGCRNQSLTSLAGQLHSVGFGKGYIYKEVLRCNQSACKPPLTADEVQRIVTSVTRYKR